MRRLIVLASTAVFIASPSFALVGGGDSILKNKGGNTVSATRPTYRAQASSAQHATTSSTPMPGSTRKSP